MSSPPTTVCLVPDLDPILCVPNKTVRKKEKNKANDICREKESQRVEEEEHKASCHDSDSRPSNLKEPDHEIDTDSSECECDRASDLPHMWLSKLITVIQEHRITRVNLSNLQLSSFPTSLVKTATLRNSSVEDTYEDFITEKLEGGVESRPPLVRVNASTFIEVLDLTGNHITTLDPAISK